MPAKSVVRRSAIADEILGKPYKKRRLDISQSSAKRQEGTPPPKPRTAKSDVGEAAAPATVKGKARVAALDNPKPDKSSSTALPSSFKIITGSYEKLLYGLDGHVTIESAEYVFKLKPVFIFPAHISCIKAVAASPGGGKWLATGSTDEIIKVWDLRRKKEIGGLMHHEGSITQLQFPSRSHLLSASEDGTLCLFRARDWAVLRSLKGHKGRVNSIAVHPSGKVALSVGKDRTMRMWDLMRGKGVASTKLGKEGELVRWSSDGSLFVVQTMSTLDIYSTDMTLLHTLTHPSRIHDVKFCKRFDGQNDIIFVAAEDKKLSIYDIPSDPELTPVIVAEMVGHSSRVKAVDTLRIALPPIDNSPRTSTTLVCTISSDGKVHLYDLAAIPQIPSLSTKGERLQINPVAEYDTKGSRLTCLAMAEGEVAVGSAVNGKRKRADGGEDEEAGGSISDGRDSQHEGDKYQDDVEVGDDEDDDEDDI